MGFLVRLVSGKDKIINQIRLIFANAANSLSLKVVNQIVVQFL